MELTLQRVNDDGASTIGYLKLDGKFFCYTLEDEARDVKVSGETRIPKGRYEIKKREVLSGMTKRYRSKYDWFDWHLELQDVPGFRYVYLHVGSYENHTDGCILVGDQQQSNAGLLSGAVFKSSQAYKRLYKRVSSALESGDKVFISVLE